MLIPDPSSAFVAHALHTPLLQGLNDEQLAAVTLPAEHALILAGAGSGKTRVLTTRIAWLLQTRQASAGSLMAVTFTNKAAKEMLTRLGAMLPVNVRGMWIGTFEAGQLIPVLSNTGHPRPTVCCEALGQAAQHRRRAFPA
jgi:DNA helicase-2/ATP-dependent DNA helicase PcrA